VKGLIAGVVAMIVIGFLEWTALHMGLDGTCFAMAIGAVAAIAGGIGGYNIKQWWRRGQLLQLS